MLYSFFNHSFQLIVSTFQAGAEWLDSIYGYFFRQPLEINQLQFNAPDLSAFNIGPIAGFEIDVSSLHQENVRCGFVVATVEHQKAEIFDRSCLNQLNLQNQPLTNYMVDTQQFNIDDQFIEDTQSRGPVR